MFNNKDFYPTPHGIIDTMLIGVDIAGKVFLEPSSGNGNIIDYLKREGAKEVLCCETSDDLAIISGQKGRLIERDFLNVKAEQISHIDCIVANPPFSADEKHILHMWDIAPGGCQIVSLCNYQTYDQAYTQERRQLKSIILKNGSIQNLGDAFSTAERKTNVEIGLIKLFKPKGSGDDEFDGYFDLSEEYEQQEVGLMGYNEIRSIVNRYVGAVKMFDSVMEANKQINELINPISNQLGITFGAVSYNKHSIDRDTFKKELQKSSWRTVFGKMKMEKYTTSSVMGQLNKFVETQEKIPFTMGNIQKMVEMIIGTHGGRMGKVLVEVFDWLTERHKENRVGLEGWKTNSMYFVGMKFIAPYCGAGMGYSGQPEIRYSGHGEKIDELVKALCYLTGKNYDNYESLYDFFRPEQVKGDNEYSYPKQYIYKEWGKWLDWGFFEIKVYKKGTLHARFKDEKVWEMFNVACSKAKGWALPTNTGSDVRRKTNGVEIYKD